jgi:hypothetical protein
VYYFLATWVCFIVKYFSLLCNIEIDLWKKIKFFFIGSPIWDPEFNGKTPAHVIAAAQAAQATEAGAGSSRSTYFTVRGQSYFSRLPKY